LGSLLGGAGGLLAGGYAGLLGYFALGGTFASGSAGASIAAFAGAALPILGPVAAALLIGSYLLGKKKQRDADEKTRTALSGDTYRDTIAVLNALRAGNMTGAEGLAQYEKIKSDYLNNAAQLKDSKTRRIAQQWLSQDFAPYYDPLIQRAAADADKAKIQDSRLIPEFAQGGLVPYQNAQLTLIKVRPGEQFIPPSEFKNGIVPGVDYGRDSVYTLAPPKTRILTRKQQLEIPHFSEGGIVGMPNFSGDGSNNSSSSQGSAQEKTLVIEQINIYEDEQGRISATIKSKAFKDAVVRTVYHAKRNKEL
jgi:hypothetical protein